jgi:heat shock protein HslJ
MRRHRHFPILIVTLLVSGAALAACGEDTGVSGGTDGGAPATAEQLEAHPWTLRSYAFGSAGDLEAASARAPGTAEFDGAEVGGTTGCNSYSGSYTLGDAGSIGFGPIASTQMFCEGVAAQEQGMLAGFEKAERVVEADGSIDFLDAAGEVVLIFDPQ